METLPHDFRVSTYKLFNEDLRELSDEDAMEHYKNHGVQENRRYKIVPPDFNYIEYLELNTDLHETDEIHATYHYEHHGYYEGRPYNKMSTVENKKQVILYPIVETDVIFKTEKMLPQFLHLYNTSLSSFKNDSKIQFRYLCFKYINYIRNVTLPDFLEVSDKEAVNIEYRCFPHLEFIIRNNIIKLGKDWCQTVICGNLNYDFMVNMCKQISPKIKVIRTNYDNLWPSEYSKFLASLPFWDLLEGKKILIYQEDAIVFKRNVEDFLYFDYIGAPWTEDKNDNRSGVGNGGISLRTKEIMKKIIKTKSIEHTVFNSCTIDYMKNTNSFIPPEDVYFTKNMEDFNIGILADRKNASKFSTESIFNPNSFAGHNFWYTDKKWKKRFYTDNIFQFKPNYDVSFLEHRGGWKDVLEMLENNHLFSKKSNVDFFDVMEKQFLWNTEFECKNKWCGIIHCTPITPKYLDIVNIEHMFKNMNFIKSLYRCEFIISLSPYLSNYLHKKIHCDLELNVQIYTLKHPVTTNNIPLFNMDSFIFNNNKILLQIGQQLRKITSIYLLDKLDCNKMWLTGSKNFKKMEDLLDKEIEYLKIDRDKMSKNVVMHYTETFEEYDDLLSKNIVFVNLFDAAANNTVLECIVRNTPIIINKIEGVTDYLGENYPLYYNHLDEVHSLIDSQKLLKAHEYLKNMDKTPFMMETFLNGLFDIVHKHFLQK
jgi:hypothetical protein